MTDANPIPWPRDGLAVLVSGGLDSAILLGEALRHEPPAVQPLYVRHGLYWETAELQHLLRDESARRQIGANGRQTILQRHTCAHRAEQLIAICEELKQ